MVPGGSRRIEAAGLSHAKARAGHVPTPTSKDVKEIPPKAADLSAWYTAVCLKAELVSYSPVRGCVVLRPYGYGLVGEPAKAPRRRLQSDRPRKRVFPALIPESLLLKEAEHVEGFAPEVAWVTQGGKEELTERLAIRPTSEVIIGVMYAQWIESYRDLPILINQWANVLRWEKGHAPVSAHDGVFVARGPHGARKRARSARGDAADARRLSRLRRKRCGRSGLCRNQERERALSGRGRDVLDRSADARRESAAVGHVARSRTELLPKPTTSNSSTPISRSSTRTRRRGACRGGCSAR